MRSRFVRWCLLALAGTVLIACSPFGPWDAWTIGQEGTQARRARYAYLMKKVDGCMRDVCQGQQELRSRNELVPLKCNTLALIVRDEKNRCLGAQRAALGASVGVDKPPPSANVCDASPRAVSLLYDTLGILRCLDQQPTS